MRTCFFSIIFLLAGVATMSQSVSVSPSRLYFTTAIGEFQSQSVTVTNNSSSPQSFQISFADFEAKGNKGKSTLMDQGESVHSCSGWLSASPAFFTIAAGKSQKVDILMQVPNLPEANKVKWAVMNVKMAHERKAPDEKDENTVGFGIVQTFQFIVHIFQTPPSVTFKNAEIISFRESTVDSDTARKVVLGVRNTGDAILDCASYLELTNLLNGETKRLDIKAFTVLPGGEREINFILPNDLKKGSYSVLGVVDYGSKEKVEAAELDLTVP